MAYLFTVQVFSGLMLSLFGSFVVSWILLGAAGYDYGDHPTDSGGGNIDYMLYLLGLVLLAFIVFFILGALFVEFIALFSYFGNTEKGYWNCYKNVYKGCVKLAWMILIPLTVLKGIILLICH